MSLPSGLGFGLGGLALLSEAQTRSISAENPKGEKGAGATAVNHLGAGPAHLVHGHRQGPARRDRAA